jgi:hypothetical protein
LGGHAALVSASSSVLSIYSSIAIIKLCNFCWVSLSQVIGNASALTQSEDWAALLADAKERGCFINSTTCIQRGLLPEPALGPLGAPLGSPSFLHPRPGGPLSRGRGIGLHGGRHSSSGRSN